MNLKDVYIADFETNNDINDCRVWAAAYASMVRGEDEVVIEENIKDFLDAIKGKKIYIHNLAFDAEFIMSYLEQKGYTNEDVRNSERANKSYSVLISDLGQFYTLRIFDRIGSKQIRTQFLDSLKKLPFKVSELSNKFNIKEEKGIIDYNKTRPIDHILTNNEIDYISKDVLIVKYALLEYIESGHTKMTVSADALEDFKNTLDKPFQHYWPPLNYITDDYIRRSLKGGVVQLRPGAGGKIIEDVIVYDLNTAHMDSARNNPMPIGDPIFYKGKYEHDKIYPLYIQTMIVELELKKGKAPTLQIKASLDYNSSTYIPRTIEPVKITITSIDFEIMKESYEILSIEYLDGFKFKQATGLFNTFVDKWMIIKENSTGAKRTEAKLMLNSVFGKFGSATVRQNKMPYLSEEGIIKYKLNSPERVQSIYTAVASFITAYTRQTLFKAINENFDNYLYSDTDSIHLKKGGKVRLEQHATKLGAWKIESEASRAKYMGNKQYLLELKDGTTKIALSGANEVVKSNINIDTFEVDRSYPGALLKKRVKGGVVLLPVNFKLKAWQPYLYNVIIV